MYRSVCSAKLTRHVQDYLVDRISYHMYRNLFSVQDRLLYVQNNLKYKIICYMHLNIFQYKINSNMYIRISYFMYAVHLLYIDSELIVLRLNSILSNDLNSKSLSTNIRHE